MNRFILALLATLIFNSLNPLFAQDFDKGLAAFTDGNYATALKEWEPLAEQGRADAQNNLGVMYENGEGVPQDFIIGYMWLNLAGANGDTTAPKAKDIVAKVMSQADISKAQAMSSACFSQDYKNCGY